MNVKDINGHLQPPEGYGISGVAAEGSYIRVTYQKVTPGQNGIEISVVSIYLNDMGREVLRTTHGYVEFVMTPVIPPVRTRWQKFRSGFSLALDGLREMRRCLKWW